MTIFTCNIASLNINGINDVSKQMKLVEFLKSKSIDIAMLQEHNIKFMSKIEYLLKFYNVILNKSILLKGGTLILIDKKLPATVCRSYLHPSSRICTCVLKIMDTQLYLVNVYAPSGKNKEQQREELFETDLMYQLVPNTDNIVMGGDWNSILLTKDTSKPRSACYSKALKSLISTFKYKDIFLSNIRKPEYTFYKKDYAARLDRIYLSRLVPNIIDTITYPVSFSDHLCVCVSLCIAPQIQVDRPRWKLNVSLLENTTIKTNFEKTWSYVKRRKSMFPNVIQWWDEMVKPTIKTLYINQGKEKNKLKLGLINYYETKLRKLYEAANNCNVFDYDAIKDMKHKIDSIREKDVEAIKVRSRIQDNICGEKISRYLIAKQKDITQRKIITKIINSEGTMLTNFSDVQKYAVKFYKTLYSSSEINNEKQAFFLSFLNNELTEEDRNILSAPLSKNELYKIARNMALNKTPGVDGFPVEFYIENWDVISDDILALYSTILQTGSLSVSQRR